MNTISKESLLLLIFVLGIVLMIGSCIAKPILKQAFGNAEKIRSVRVVNLVKA